MTELPTLSGQIRRTAAYALPWRRSLLRIADAIEAHAAELVRVRMENRRLNKALDEIVADAQESAAAAEEAARTGAVRRLSPTLVLVQGGRMGWRNN